MMRGGRETLPRSPRPFLRQTTGQISKDNTKWFFLHLKYFLRIGKQVCRLSSRQLIIAEKNTFTLWQELRVAAAYRNRKKSSTVLLFYEL